MIFKKLSEWPSSKILKIMLIIGFALSFAVIPVMQYFTQLSGFPAEIFSSQLSFSGTLMKSFYALTDITLYRIAPSLDYIFMTGYGLILFSSALIVARRYRTSSLLQKEGFIVALSGVIAACCDAIENVFILLMLTDPTGFPDYWAITHSVFALVKWILLVIVIIWVIFFLIISLIKGKSTD
ncbi:MAG: hypothetical protein ACFE8G_10160 [Candidatus Hermodarchaeota archaeon]